MDRLHYLNLFKELSLPLLDITYTNGKLILTDKRLDVAVEIGNLLFRLNDQLHYDNEEFEIVKLLTGSKKQKKVIHLFNFMISYLIYRMTNQKTETGEMLIDGINHQLDKHIRQRFNDIAEYMSSAENPNDIIWNQSLFDDIRSKIKDDIVRARYKPTGTKGFGKCGRCNSEELYVNEKQTRGLDEPQTVLFLCLSCGHNWKR